MKSTLLLLATLVLCTINGFSQSPAFAGDWQGKIAAFNLKLVFHITEKDGQLSATMDSPDQGAKGIRCDKVEINGDAITITLTAIGGSYTGTISADRQTIKGQWSQGGGSFDLDLTKGEIPADKPKPQTPQPPFPYQVEELEYDNADKSVHFGATFTYPSTGTKFPAVILISGSGQQDRDESIMGHKPFAVLADRLTRLGMAVLRVDDRGIGKTTGEVRTATSADFANDVITGIEYLKSRKEVDPKKIGMLGHSEGGLIASLVAANRKDIDFIILLAGPGIRGADLLAEQGEYILLKSGVSKEAVSAYMPLYKGLIKLSLEESESTLQNSAKKFFDDWVSAAQASHLQQLGMDTKEAQDGVFQNLLVGFSEPWMKYFLQSDASVHLQKINAKVLALNGEHDIQVIATSNTRGIENALKKSKSKVYEVKVLPGLNHLFQKCNNCSITEYASLEESFSETALTEISNWLKKNVLK